MYLPVTIHVRNIFSFDILSSRVFLVHTVQDFLIKLGVKPRMHLLEIDIFWLYHVIVRPTKIMITANKNWAKFRKKSFQNQKNHKCH